MSEDFKPPQPTAEHRMLAENAGTWKVACTYYMGPEPFHTEATETVEMIGAFWSVSLFESDFMGMPFRGKATVGFDPASRQWVSTWTDSGSPNLFVMRGTMNDAGDAVTLTGEGPHPQTRQPTTFRTVERRTGKDTREFEMHMTNPDGSEHMMFRYLYTRAAQ